MATKPNLLNFLQKENYTKIPNEFFTHLLSIDGLRPVDLAILGNLMMMDGFTVLKRSTIASNCNLSVDYVNERFGVYCSMKPPLITTKKIKGGRTAYDLTGLYDKLFSFRNPIPESVIKSDENCRSEDSEDKKVVIPKKEYSVPSVTSAPAGILSQLFNFSNIDKSIPPFLNGNSYKDIMSNLECNIKDWKLVKDIRDHFPLDSHQDWVKTRSAEECKRVCLEIFAYLLESCEFPVPKINFRS